MLPTLNAFTVSQLPDHGLLNLIPVLPTLSGDDLRTIIGNIGSCNDVQDSGMSALQDIRRQR